MVRVVLSALIMPMTALFAADAAAPPERPNIVMILVDSLRADRLSAYGYPRPTSPFADGLAQNGVRFENYFAASTWTMPCVMSLFTGLSPIRHGRANLADPPRDGVPKLAEVLKAAGYHTVAVTVNQVAGGAMGFDRGFDIFDDHTLAKEISGDAAMMDAIAKLVEAKGVDARLASLALEYVDKLPAGEPFFVLLFLFDPHWEYFPLDEYRNLFTDPEYAGAVDGSYFRLREGGPDGWHLETEADLRHFSDLYDAEIRQADDAARFFVAALRERGRLTDSDLLIFTADHGEEFMEHGVLSHGKNLYDPAFRVPLILYAPAWLPRGAASHAMASHLDWLPTLAALAGAEAPAGLPGANLLAFADGQWSPPAREAVFGHTALDEPGARPMAAIRTARYKVIRFLDTGDAIAFDMRADPGEQTPLPAAGDPEREDLLQKLDEWRAEEARLADTRPAP